MLRRSHTATLELNETYTGSFDTEPYECGWASEAAWFVRVIELAAGTVLTAVPQWSPDGLHWCDLEGAAALQLTAPGLRGRALRDFGGWLRLRCRLAGDRPRVRLMVHLALKE